MMSSSPRSAVFLVCMAATLCGIAHGLVVPATMPLPFTRALVYSPQPMQGDDVLLFQHFMNRVPFTNGSLPVDSSYDAEDYEAVIQLQKLYPDVLVDGSGVVGPNVAGLLLDKFSDDGYKDSGFTAKSMGYLYKLHVRVHRNRSIETMTTLYDGDNTVLHTFRTRQHGHRGDGTTQPWPDFGDGDDGLNMFSPDGNTPTGLVEVDLNTPEPDPNLYGPYPVNRFVRGLDGNSKFLQPLIRDGVLLHTGNWTGWNPTMDMPNSSGCIHAHPDDILQVYLSLTKLGVVPHTNPYSGKNYPFKPQGIAVVELID